MKRINIYTDKFSTTPIDCELHGLFAYAIHTHDVPISLNKKVNNAWSRRRNPYFQLFSLYSDGNVFIIGVGNTIKAIKKIDFEILRKMYKVVNSPSFKKQILFILRENSPDTSYKLLPEDSFEDVADDIINLISENYAKKK